MRATRAAVERAVLESIHDIAGTPVERIALDQTLIGDLRMDGDDFTFVFVPDVERALGLRTDARAWSQVRTVQQAIDVFLAASAS